MAKVSVYLNFQGNTEEAFQFYRNVFKSQFTAPIMRMGEIPPHEGMPPIPENEKQKVMYGCLPILGGMQIMGSDMLESMGHQVKVGNNISINLEPDSREEVDRLFALLAEGDSKAMPPMDMFWGAYWASCQDKYGVRWMFNYTKQN